MRTDEAKFELVVFDWDGTLMDSAAAIVQAMQAACRDLEVPEPTEERARHVIGLGLQEALRYAVPDLPGGDYVRMVERYRYHYLAGDHQLVLFPGVTSMMASLAAKGRLLAVATGKSRVGLNRALAQSGLGAFFHATRCADETFSKPHPAMLEQLLDELGVSPEQAVMVGDTTHDLQMAKNAGVASLAVSFGAHPKRVLEDEAPLACVDTPKAMAEWLAART